MWLLICDAQDRAALWAARGLQARGLRPLRLVTPMELVCAEDLELRIVGAQVEASATLASGQRIQASRLRGCLNRCTAVDYPVLSHAAREERDYLRAEWDAVLLGWLGALAAACPRVINAAQPWALAGPTLSPLGWALAAQRAGLATPPARCGFAGPEPLQPEPGEQLSAHVLLGAQSYPPAPAGCEPALRELRRSSGLALLGVTLGHRPGWPARFIAATPMPDLRVGGEPLLDALAQELKP